MAHGSNPVTHWDIMGHPVLDPDFVIASATQQTRSESSLSEEKEDIRCVAEAIVPLDLRPIFAQDLRDLLNGHLALGVKFTMVAGPFPSISCIRQWHSAGHQTPSNLVRPSVCIQYP